MVPEEHMDVENPTETNEEKPKRKLEKTILDNFSKLVNPHDRIRVKSAANLVKHLTENENTEKETNELKYALKRLIRGLGSSSTNARIGFYTALLGLINSKADLNVVPILEQVETELHRSAKNTSGENADICTGQILTCGAILRSSLWSRSTKDEQKKVLELLLKASKERTYLGLFGYMFITNSLDDLSEKNVRKTIFPLLEPEIAKPWSEQNLDSLYLLLSLKNKYSDLIGPKFLKKCLGSDQLVCAENLNSLGQILMTILRVTSVDHPVYDIIIKDLVDSEHLVAFFEELDTHLRIPNRNRLLVFIKILSNVYSFSSNDKNIAISELLTTNFIIQTLGYFRTFRGKQKDLEFQQNVKKLFEDLLTALKNENVRCETKISVLKKFLFYPGTFIFEKVTRSKIVQQITQNLDAEGVQKLAEVYKGVIRGTERIDSQDADNENWLNNDRLYAAHLLIKLLNHQSMKNENEWKVEQLAFLMKVGLLREENGVSVGRELADSLKTAFFGALDLKLSKLEDLQIILSKLVHNLDSQLAPDNLETILRNPISLEDYEIWQKTIATVSKIEKKKKKGQGGLKSVFLTLFLHMGLQLFNDLRLATDSLKELFSCYERIKKDKKNRHNLNDSQVMDTTIEANENDPVWIEVVTDLFLNLLSHNSHLLRSIINCVFPHLCQYLTASTIQQIVSVLDPKNDDNPLSKDAMDDSDSEESDSEEEKEDSEEELTEEEEEEEDISDDETANEKLRIALHKALSGNGYQTDEESIDLDQMSDTEGEKLDEALAEAFGEFKPNHGRRKKQTRNQETLTHFRVRVLDLIEIYIDSIPSMILSLEIMLPLLQAVEFSIRDEHQKPLHDRLKSCLKKLTQLKKFSDTNDVDDSVLTGLLKSLLERGTKNVIIMQEMGEQIADCCVFVVRCADSLRVLEDTPKKTKKHLKKGICEVICVELQSYLTKRDCLTPYVLFKNLLQICWDGNLSLVTLLLGFIFDDEVKQYKKNQACELLKLFYLNYRLLKDKAEKIKEKLSEDHKNLSDNVLRFFKELCADPEKKSVKEKFVCNLFNLLSLIKNCPLKIEEIDWSGIAENAREYRSYKTFSNDAKQGFNKLCRTLGVSHIVKMKGVTTKLSNAIEDVEDKESLTSKSKDNKKKKNKKRNTEKLKLKKEAKELRLQSLSEGFSSSLDFNVAKNEDIEENGVSNGDSSDVEETKMKKKKRKISSEGNAEAKTQEILLNGENGEVKNEKRKKKGKDVAT